MTLQTIRLPLRLGGNLALDYINTTEFRGTERCQEMLLSFDHVLAFCVRNDLLSAEEGAYWGEIAADHAAEAGRAYQVALDLREALYRIFVAVIADETPDPSDLDQLNNTLDAGKRHIVPSEDGFSWAWASSSDLAHVLRPIALIAAELLTSPQLQQVRQCPNCRWLFVDTSRNHKRRWCSMDFCGSQVKSRRQYERRKNMQGSSDSLNSNTLSSGSLHGTN